MTPAGHFAILRSQLQQIGQHIGVATEAFNNKNATNLMVCLSQLTKIHSQAARALDVAETEILQRELFQ